MKSIKFILVMAALAATLSFVSCSNEAQDVNISYKKTATYYKHAGFATGSVAFSYTTTNTVFVYSAAPLASVEYTDGSYGEGDTEYKSDEKRYTVTIPVKKIYVSGDSDIEEPYFTLRKIGDTYYCGEEKIVVTGSPEDDEFTLTGIMKDRKNNDYIFSTITFKRVE